MRRRRSGEGDGDLKGREALNASGAGLQRMFWPKAVAIVGASGDPTRIGGRPVHYLKTYGFSGRIFPINPSRGTVQGLPAYPSLMAMPEDIDIALLAIPARAVPEMLEAAAAKGASAVVVLSSGFAEVGEEGQALQAHVEARASELGVRLLGPNTLGFYAAPSRTVATFSSFFECGEVPEGPTAIVSQSGAFGTHLGIKAVNRGIGLRYWVTTGNEADLSTADIVRALAADPKLRAIGVYLEGLKDGRALMSAIAAARDAGKRVVVIKVGRTPIGSRAAQSHTASLAGDDAVFDRAIAQAGAVRVTRADEFLETLYVLSRGHDFAGDRLGLLTVSGGAGVLMADAAHVEGFAVPPMPAAAQLRLREICPFGSPSNPVDVTAQSMNEPRLITEHLRAMFDAGGYDAVVGFFMNWLESPVLAERVKAAVQAGITGFEDRIFVLVANVDEKTRREFESLGMLVFDDPTAAIEALGRLRHQSASGRGRNWTIQRPENPTPLPDRLTEYDSLKLVAASGVSIPQIASPVTPEAAGAAAERIGVPVALKILTPDIAHKTEAGGVALNLDSGAAVEAGAHAMADRVAAYAPNARIEGFLVAPMVSGVAECIVGARVDPTFGPVVMVGLGGIHAEVFRDVALSVAPITSGDALEMLRSLQSWPLLNGVRASVRADVAALADTMVALSEFVIDHWDSIESAELNPVSVGAAGHGVRALDAYIERKAGK